MSGISGEGRCLLSLWRRCACDVEKVGHSGDRWFSVLGVGLEAAETGLEPARSRLVAVWRWSVFPCGAWPRP